MIHVKQIKRKTLEVELLEKVAHISELEQERAKSSDVQKVEQQLTLEVKDPQFK